MPANYKFSSLKCIALARAKYVDIFKREKTFECNEKEGKRLINYYIRT